MLERHKVDFTPDEPITHLAAGHNQVVIATKDKKILTIDTRSSKESYCDIARYLGNRLAQAKVYNLFLDPTGKFVLISLAYAADNQPLENLLYVNQVQALTRLKNHLISAIAWDFPKTGTISTTTNTNSTGTILLGTTKGLVLQTEFIHSDETKFFPLTPGPRQYVKELFDVGLEAGSITGLEYHQIVNNSQTEKSFIILVCTDSRLYRMVGNVPANVDPPQLHLIFGQNSTNYKEIPGRLNHSKLDLYYPPSPTNSPPIRFAWLTEPGVMTSEIFNQLSSCKSSFNSDEDINLIPYTNPEEVTVPLSSSTLSTGMSPPFNGMMAGYYQDKPISIVVTKFHIVILFRHCIRAICILNNLTVYEEYFSPNYGNVHGMSKDPVRNIIWVYCKRAVFRYKIANENKNVWKIYLEQKRFDLARKYSSGDEVNFDRVVCEEAQHYFRLKEYEKSAEIFARSKKAFEDVSLMFMEVRSTKALKKYLSIRLEEFDSNQTTQLTMTLGWLFELIVSSISRVTQCHASQGLLTSGGLTNGGDEKTAAELDELFVELDTLFENKIVVDCIRSHSSLFYGIIKNYSNWDLFVRVAKLVGDYEHVVQCYLDLGDCEKALEVLRSVKKADLFYKYGHILMKRMPKELVDALIQQRDIKPTKLIPVLIQENLYFNKCQETKRFLEHCINELNTDSKVIHNYLFELYARNSDESQLMSYLENEISTLPGGGLFDSLIGQQSPQQQQQQQYCSLDLQLCLRLCTELKLVKTCVMLYSYMGLYDEAVHLALTFDMELAKSIAKKVDPEDHQKRLWLSIAENVLSKDADIQVATSLLRECRLLKIEDILPFFPDYTTIDFFKDAIRQSLQEYRNQIMSLRDGTYDNIADEIRGEIKAFRSRYSIIKVGQRCEICSHSIMSRTFYVFPCGHLFHNDCIIKEIIAMDPQYKGIEEKLKQLTLDQIQQPATSGVAPVSSSSLGQLSSSNKFMSSYTKQQAMMMINSASSQQGANQTRQQQQQPPLAQMIETNKEKLVAELDEIISSECIYCGSLLASYVDKPAPVSCY